MSVSAYCGVSSFVRLYAFPVPQSRVIADLFDRDPGARIGRGGRQREAHDDRKGQDQRKQPASASFHTFSSLI